MRSVTDFRVGAGCDLQSRFSAGFTVSLLAVLLLGASRLAGAAGSTPSTNAVWFAEHYTKYEHLIPMRDGVRLFTRVYVPKEDSQAWPILLTRTPYALKPYGAANYTDPSGSFKRLAE